jgi:LysR family glycine cleavage system transcriptional activator
MPRLAGFIAANPDIALKISASPVPANFLKDSVDIDIRYGRTNWRDGATEPMMVEHVSAFCSPIYFQRLGAPTTLDILARATLIHPEVNVVQWTDWLSTNGISNIDTSRGLRFDRSILAIQAALDHLGVVIDSHMMVGKYLAENSLIKMFPDSRDVECSAYFLVYPENHLAVASVRQFRDWVQAVICEETAKSPRAF